MKSLLAAWVVLILAISGAAAPSSQEPTGPGGNLHGTIKGCVLPAEGERFLPDRVIVSLTFRRSDIALTQQVSGMGLFEFKNLRDGSYTLKAESPGYAFADKSVTVAGSLRGETVEADLTLGRRLSEGSHIPAPSAGKTVSAHWLSVPKKAVRQMEKAERASRSGDQRKAVEHLKKALEFHLHLPEAYNNLAVQYVRLGEADLAVEAFRKAIELRPEDALAHANLGVILLASGDFGQAVQHLQRAEQLQPGKPATLAFLAEAHFRRGEFRLALEHYERAFQADPRRPELLLGKADCLIRLGRVEEAADALRRFVAQAPGDERSKEAQSRIEQLEAARGPGK
ncbi:MAG: tetratricopeptide repeat protein [Acidobacteriota bacterium]